MNLSAEVERIAHAPKMDHVIDERLILDKKDDDDSCCSSDSDEILSIQKVRGGRKNTSIRRTDSWESFMTRSERALALGKDKPPSQKEARTRKVQFVADDRLNSVLLLEAIPEDTKSSYYMNETDFDRLDKDISLTRFRWENHKAGKIKFDENLNSVRGLEDMFEPDKKKDLEKYKHVRNILGAINEQKLSGRKEIDWEQIRNASVKTSTKFLEHALARARKDEEARHHAWSGSVVDKVEWTPKVDKDKKKSKGLGFMFWKK
jgi:hypothetical protein